MITPFGNQKKVQGNSKYSDVVRNRNTNFIVNTSMVKDIKNKEGGAWKKVALGTVV